MALQEFGLGVVIGGLVASSFKNSVKYASTSISKIDDNVKKLSKTKLEIKTFNELSKDASKNRAELTRLSGSLKRAGISTNNLDQDAKALHHTLARLKTASKIQIKIDSDKNKFMEQKNSILGIGAALYGTTRLIGSANNVIKAQGEIKSLGITEKGINSITKAGHEMSLQFGQITGPEFIKASYDIKSGIASLSDEGVKDMTKMAATTAVATKSSTAEMTKLYALGYGIFREDFSSDMDFGKKFQGAIAGAVQAFRTDGSDLSQGISNVGASAKAMGVSLEEELAIIGMSKSAFNSASEAGSGYRGFLSGVGKAQEKLGLEFVDTNGKLLPMVQVLEKIKNKYGDLELSEIDELKSAFGSDEAIKIITALMPKTEELANAQKDLKKAMSSDKAQEMAQAMNQGYGYEKMGNAMKYMSFTVGKILSPAVDVLATGLGGLAMGINWVDEKAGWLLPTVVGLSAGIIGLVTVLKVGSLAKLGMSLAVNTLKKSFLLNTAASYANMTSINRVNLSTTLATAKTKAYSLWQGITATKTKAVTLATTLYGRSLMFSGVTLGSLGAKLKAFSIISTYATAKQWLFNIALNANPIGLMITGITALGAGAIWLYKNFEPFTNLINGIWDNAKKFFGWIGDKLNVVTDAFSGIGSFFGSDDEDEKPTNNLSYGNGIKKAVAPIAISTALAAQPLNIPEHKVNTKSLNIPTHKEIQTLSQNNSNVTHNNSSTSAPISKSYTIQVIVQNPSSSIDITEAVKQAIHDIESANKETSMEDTY